MILIHENINTLKITEALLDANKEVGLEVNADKTKYIYLSSVTSKENKIKV
jgi:hypothetical protein